MYFPFGKHFEEVEMTHDAMAQVAAQREHLADRARLPWWFWGLFGFATVGLIGGPLVQHWLGEPSYYAVFLPSGLIYVLAERLVRRSRGISFSGRTMRAFPSSRRPGTVFVVVVAVAFLTVVTTTRTVPAVAVTGLVVGTVLSVACMAWLQRAMLADVRAGRVRPA